MFILALSHKHCLTLTSETVGFIAATAIAFAIIVIENKAVLLNGRANNDFLFNCLCFDFATMRIRVPTNHAKQTFVFVLCGRKYGVFSEDFIHTGVVIFQTFHDEYWI